MKSTFPIRGSGQVRAAYACLRHCYRDRATAWLAFAWNTQLGIHEQGHHTPAYASPEQLQGLALDYHSDIYSLGVVICELLAGQGLFPGLLQHLEAPPSITQKFGVPVSPAIEAVVAKALAKQPAQRYQCAGEMANAF